MRRTYILIGTIVAMALLFAISAERAQAQTIPPRTCSSTNSLGTVTAGPCWAGLTCDSVTGIAKDFPRTVNCPEECNGAVIPGTTTLLSGLFTRWDYEYKGSATASPSLIGLQVSAETTLKGAIGGDGNWTNISANLSDYCIGNSALQMGAGDCDSKWLQISGNCSATNPYKVSIFTDAGYKMGYEGVSFKSGKLVGYCGIQGVSSPGCFDVNRALYTDLTFTMPGPCTVSYQVTPDCKAIDNSMQVIAGDCTVTNTAGMDINSAPVLDIGAACPVVTYTQPGSCNYCIATAGGTSCSTCSTCCINAATSKCVLKSSLSNPATQCKSGTY